jgi:hypothetical protein
LTTRCQVLGRKSQLRDLREWHLAEWYRLGLDRRVAFKLPGLLPALSSA